jgi:hypothetical protein
VPTARLVRPLLASAAGLGLLAGLSACSQELPTADVGACMDSSDLEGQIVELPTVPCDEAHDAQVVGKFDLSEGDYPGDETVTEQSTDRCATEFEQFVGVAVDQSSLELKFVAPNDQTWDADNGREVLCFAVTLDGSTVTESWEDSQA